MRIKCYCNLYTGTSVTNKKNQYLLDLMNGKFTHSVHLITLAQGMQNHLEIFSSSLLRQQVYDEKEIFVVGIAGKYYEAVALVEEIVQDVLEQTGNTQIRNYIETQQKVFEEGRM